MVAYLFVVSLNYTPSASFFNLRASGNAEYPKIEREGIMSFYSPLIYPRRMEEKVLLSFAL